MQYSSTSVRSLPLKRIPIWCSKHSATKNGLRESPAKRSGKAGLELVSVSHNNQPNIFRKCVILDNATMLLKLNPTKKDHDIAAMVKLAVLSLNNPIVLT